MITFIPLNIYAAAYFVFAGLFTIGFIIIRLAEPAESNPRYHNHVAATRQWAILYVLGMLALIGLRPISFLIWGHGELLSKVSRLQNWNAASTWRPLARARSLLLCT